MAGRGFIGPANDRPRGPFPLYVYDSLGEAQAIAGRREQAIESYRKVIALDPANANARARLKELEKRPARDSR